MLKQKYFLTGIFILSAERQPIKLAWRKIVWLHIKEELEKLLKCPVDVVRLRNNMDELLRGCINKDGIYV